jgi:hypothetical protein
MPWYGRLSFSGLMTPSAFGHLEAFLLQCASDRFKINEIGLDSIIKLSQSSFGWKSLVKTLTALPYLTNMTVSDVELSDQDLLPLLSGSQALCKLDLSHNRFTDFCIVAEQLARHGSSLTILNLSDNNIGNAGCHLLFPTICRFTQLISLTLSRTQIGAEGARVLAKNLRLGRSILTTLNLSDNILVGSHAFDPYACAAILASTFSLTELNLDACFLECPPVYAETVISALSECILHPSCNLTCLSLATLPGDSHYVILARVLNLNDSLTSLFFGDDSTNEVSPERLAPFAEAISLTNSLTKLYLPVSILHPFTVHGADSLTLLQNSLSLNTSLYLDVILNFGSGLELPSIEERKTRRTQHIATGISFSCSDHYCLVHFSEVSMFM